MTLKYDSFQTENHLHHTEKLALLSFMAREFDLGQFVTLAGPNLAIISEFIWQELTRHKTKVDLIFCDLSGYSEFDPGIMEKFLSLFSTKVIVCVEGLGHEEQVRLFSRDVMQPVRSFSDFSIGSLYDGARSIGSLRYQIDLFRRRYFFENERQKRRDTAMQSPLITAIVLTYNHEHYIAESLNSVLTQQGNFRLRVIIIDDASSDQTTQTVRTTIAGRCTDAIEIEFHVNSENRGVVQNLATAVQMAAGCDYLTFCEGDDFWSSKTRIQEHLDFLQEHNECVMSFNTIELCSANGSMKKVYDEHSKLTQEILDGDSLSAFNWIGNFSACFYDGALAKIVPEELFSMYTVDWMFNLYCSQFGAIGHLRKPLSVYRQHEGGEWSNRQEWDKTERLSKLIDIYNSFLDFQYDEGLQKYKKLLFDVMNNNHLEKCEKYELLILDDIFPAPCSGFRFAEFTAYLEEFPKTLILTSGLSLSAVGDESLRSVIQKFQRRYPELGNRVMESTGPFPVRLAKLMYVNFFNNAYALLPVAEESKVPFAFTLYPGGGFVLNSRKCDRKLKRIFDSPCFLKVIVTQQLTYDYLINKGLCPTAKIELIFGVVMPQDAFINPIPGTKLRWGISKERMDICFMAHRYTPHGVDKGYDVFINMACALRKRHEDIYFHVVGPFDRRVINISPISDRIKFHGTLNPEQLDDFFKDMDIIMSPNISGKISLGSFDGFPTASCTEGGLRGTAIFCTDEFNCAAGHFVNGRDFVLIRYDLDHIVNMVEQYYRDPEKLRMIGEYGSRRILELYSYQSQMTPRVRLLRELISSPFVYDNSKRRALSPYSATSTINPLNLVSSPVPSQALGWLRKNSPESMKIFYRKYIRKYVG